MVDPGSGRERRDRPSVSPQLAGDATFTYDFMATTRTVTATSTAMASWSDPRQGSPGIKLDWSFEHRESRAARVCPHRNHAPTDGMTSGGTTFNRQFTITRGTDTATRRFGRRGPRCTAAATTRVRGRHLRVGTGATPDLLQVSPARTPPADPDANGTSAAVAVGNPSGNGCVEFTYTRTGSAPSSIRAGWHLQPQRDRLSARGRSDRTDPGSIKDRSTTARPSSTF